MARCLSLTLLLVLMLPALNAVRLEEDPPKWLENSTGTSQHAAKPDNMTNQDTVTQHGSMLNSTSPVGETNKTDSLPASPLPRNATAGKPITTSPDIPSSTANASLPSVTSGSNSTRPNYTGLPEVSNTTISSPLNPTTKSWPSHGTGESPNATVTAAPESRDNASTTAEHIPQMNSSSTTRVTASTSTTNSTAFSTRVTASTSTTNSTAFSTRVMAGASGNNSDGRGFGASNTKARNNTHAWGAIFGTALGVGFVAFIIYILLKKKNGRQFMHRKLIEDMPSEPVLRLDNSEPLDLKFDGVAYYNGGLQGDHIQMTNFPQGHIH